MNHSNDSPTELNGELNLISGSALVFRIPLSSPPPALSYSFEVMAGYGEDCVGQIFNSKIAHSEVFLRSGWGKRAPVVDLYLLNETDYAVYNDDNPPELLPRVR